VWKWIRSMVDQMHITCPGNAEHSALIVGFWTQDDERDSSTPAPPQLTIIRPPGISFFAICNQVSTCIKIEINPTHGKKYGSFSIFQTRATHTYTWFINSLDRIENNSKLKILYVNHHGIQNNNKISSSDGKGIYFFQLRYDLSIRKQIYNNSCGSELVAHIKLCTWK
jgi:hypothetical protein